MSKRRALITYASNSIWESCSKIIPNLNAAYQTAFGEDCFKHFQLAGKPYENIDVSKEISEYNPDQLIFTDNRLSPLTLLENLKESGFYDGKIKEHIIHIYGNPYFRGAQYLLGCAAYLKDQKFSFRSSSTRFINVLESLYGDSPNTIQYFPYPTMLNLTQYKKSERERIRQKLKLESDDKLIIYAGRISPGKNIHNLLKCFQEIHLNNKNTHFLLIGKFDDYEWPTQAGYYENGRYRILISQQLAELKREGLQIDYLPHLEFGELRKYYLAADLQMSFSLSKGEDFGMSILEGLQTGLPCLISDWGGHSDFNVVSKGVNFLKVHWSKDGPEVETSKFAFQQLESFLLTDSEKTELSQRAVNIFSIKSASELIKKSDTQFSEITLNKQLFMIQHLNIHLSHLHSNETQRKYYEKFYI